MNRKQKKLAAINLKLLFFKKLKKFTRQFFRIILWPKMVQPNFELKTCCIVNNNKYIPDKAVHILLPIAVRPNVKFTMLIVIFFILL